MRNALCALILSSLLAPASLAAAALDLKPRIEEFKPYIVAQYHASRIAAEELLRQLKAGDIAASREAWKAARPGWERAETVGGEFFGDIDKKVDAWPTAESGFHAIEARLFGKAPNAAEMVPLAEDLAKNLAEIEKRAEAADYSVQGLYNGVTQLAFEVGESKSTGNESLLSGTSLDDMRHNAEGLSKAYDILFAGLFKAQNPKADAEFRKRLAELQSALAAPDISKLNPQRVERAGELVALVFVRAAPGFGLEKPKLEEEGN
jgi:iron uptake system EfeUOB component EfeO/EfeM